MNRIRCFLDYFERGVPDRTRLSEINTSKLREAAKVLESSAGSTNTSLHPERKRGISRDIHGLDSEQFGSPCVVLPSMNYPSHTSELLWGTGHVATAFPF